MSKTTNKFSPEVRERAVGLVLETEGHHSSRWQAVISIAGKIGCTAQTLNEWVKKAEVDCGRRAGLCPQDRRLAGQHVGACGFRPRRIGTGGP
jgi:transposase-like protein